MDDVGTIKLPALDNHSMGVIFEELIRKFNEENNEEAGEHFTPRDVVELMADCVFMPIADKIKDSTYSCYDGASGTGGMLTVAQDRLIRLAQQQGKTVSIHLFGQEINPETYAIAKADMLLKGEGEEAEHIVFGSTLSGDGFPSHEFDFMLSNPPYGKSWKVDAEKLGGKKEILDRRFVTSFKGEPGFSMIPRTSDGQLLFLLNNVSKMKEGTELGSRIAEVHNGSSLFTGDAGQGESNARRYLIENDWVEAIIALPENMFYNTGIGTFIWILSNRKDAKRRGKIQLIDATGLKSPLRKNLGKKNCEFTEEIRQHILELYTTMTENEQSKVFTNEAFGYRKITVLRPLRLRVDYAENQAAFDTACRTNPRDKAKPYEEEFSAIVRDFVQEKQTEIFYDYNVFISKLTQYMNAQGKKMSKNQAGLIRNFLCVTDPEAEKVIHKEAKGHTLYEHDSALTDTEQIPLTYEGGTRAFFEKEVKPFAPDAWVDEKSTLVGYEISFTKYFYKPVALRSLEEIVADIKALEQETEGLLNEIIGG